MSVPENCMECNVGAYADCTYQSLSEDRKLLIPGPECPYALLAAKERECEGLQNDSRRIDALEDALWHGSVGNGIAIFPCTMMRDGKKLLDVTALGHEDGSNLGEELVGLCTDLRDAIDKLRAALAEGGAE